MKWVKNGIMVIYKGGMPREAFMLEPNTTKIVSVAQSFYGNPWIAW